MIDGAFHLLTSPVRDRLLNVCLLHTLFCDLYEALATAQGQTGLTPEEVWSEAAGAALKLGQSPRPDFFIRHDYDGLLGRYRTFIGPDATPTHRTDSEADATRCAVYVTLLCMLAAASPVAQNRHAKLCVFIIKCLREHPLYQRLCQDIRQSEIREEADGHRVPPTDYTRHTDADAATDRAEEERMRCIDELVQEAIDSHSPQICSSVLHVLTGYNEKHACTIQSQIARLHEAINRMAGEISAPRRVENNGIINHIENNQGPVNGDVKEQRFLMGNSANGKQIEQK